MDTGSGASVMVICRSAASVTVVKSEEVLLLALVSPRVETPATLLTKGTAVAPTLTVSVIVLVAPAARGPALVQVTTWTAAEQLQPVPVPDTKPKPVGRISSTVLAPNVPPVVAALPT